MGPSFRAGATGMGQGIQVVSSHSHSSGGLQPCPHPGRADLRLWKDERNQTHWATLWRQRLLWSALFHFSVSCLFLNQAMVGRKESHSLRNSL